MTNKEKLEKLKKLADAMYYATQQLTTDASRLHKAMDEYHQFIINEYHKEEPTIPDIVDEHFYEMLDEEPVNNVFEMALAEMIDKAQTSVVEPLVIAAQWKDELIKLVKSEEPVSEIDFEQELYKYFGQVKDFTLGMRIAKRFYEIGRNHKEPISEDLLKELKGIVNIRECVAQGVPVIKIARHFANWKKEQMMNDAVEARFTLLDGFCIDRELYKNYKVGGKYKLIIIKEDLL